MWKLWSMALISIVSIVGCPGTESNGPPVAGGVSVNTAKNTAVTFNLDATDPEGGTIAYTIGTGPSHGTVTIANSTEPAVTYTPNTDYVGSDSFTYYASDGSSYMSEEATVTITITDPTANNPGTTAKTISVGTAPTDVAMSPNGSYIYVANSGSNSVSVIQTSDNTVTATIAVNGPEKLVVSPDGAYVYVTTFSNSQAAVSIIQTSDNTVSGTIALNHRLDGIAVSPNGTSIYTTYDTSYTFQDHLYVHGTISIINASSHNLTGTILFDDYLQGVATSSDGAYLYQAISDDSDTTQGSVSVIRLSDRATIKTLTVGSNPQDLAVSSNGAYVYVTNYDSDTASVIQTSDNTVAATVTVGDKPYGVAVSPDRAYVYVANSGSNTVSVIRTSDNTVVNTLTVGTNPYSLVVSTDGTSLYVAAYGDNTVVALKLVN
jgi:YVTN family beta-propeller protein